MSGPDWREDPDWRLVVYDPARYTEQTAPSAPTPDAELSQPPLWASLYDDGRIVATWWRPSAPSETPVTVAAE